MASRADSRPTPAERERTGKRARRSTSRSSHGRWKAAADRPDPVAILREQDATRIQELVPIRHERMLASAFTFYRGAAAVMAADLGAAPSTGLRVQLCGDAHLSNFGVFESPDRRLVFDINDFDETLPGPFEWDVKRLAASLVIAARDDGFTAKQGRAAAASSARRYRETIRELASRPAITLWYERADVEAMLAALGPDLDPSQRALIDKSLAKARRKDSNRAMHKLAEWVDGVPRVVSQPPLIVPIEELTADRDPGLVEGTLRELLAGYRGSLDHDRRRLIDHYDYVHAARKVVGVGSVGASAWVFLLTGRDYSDPLFLQAKEAGPSVLAPFAGPSRFRHQGRRVVEGQRLMQASGDILLGWLTAPGIDGRDRDFYVRQLWDGKLSIDTGALTPKGLDVYGGWCGEALARAHARSGDRIAIAGYLGRGTGFDRAIASFAQAYADQNDRDYEAAVTALAR